MRERPAGVLAASDARGRRIVDGREEDLGPTVLRQRDGDVHPVAAATRVDGAVPSLRRVSRRGADSILVAAQDIVVPVHHRLRGVDVEAPQTPRIRLLPLGEDGARVRVAPAEGIPVVDVLRQRDDFYAAHGLLTHEAREERVRRRAARTTFGGEQLDEDGYACFVSARGQCRREEHQDDQASHCRIVAARDGTRRPVDLLDRGIHLLHKPAGPTSFSLVQPFIAEAAALTRKVPVCHGGALDPFAEGLLPILVGRATRLFDLLHVVPKHYEARVAWGAETDNGDPLGQVVARGDPSRLTPRRLDEALTAFVGWREQVPPPTSNKRIGGERAYARVHRGEHVELPAARVYLHEARWTAHDLPRASQLRLVVGGGYYVRALVRDLGRALGCRAHVAALSRTAIGPWQDPGPGRTELVRGTQLLPWLRARTVNAEEARILRRGASIPAGTLHAPEWPLPEGFPEPESLVRGLFDGQLVAIARESGKMLTPVIHLGGI